MKKLILLALVLVLTTACQEVQKQRYFGESAEIDIIMASIEAYEKADWDTWKGHFADTAKIYVNSNTPVTLNARAKELKEMSTAFSSYGFDKDDAHIEMVVDKKDETWVYYWAEHNATMAANKKELSIPVHIAVRFDGGKIVTEHVYYDGTELNKAIEELTAANERESE